MFNFFHHHPIISLAGLAFLLNVPCGYIRQGHPKFSSKWFLWIHASIPFIIYARIHMTHSKLAIPLGIIAAVYGQIVGGRWRRSRMTNADTDKLEQIPDFQLPLQQAVPDSNVAVVLMNMGGPKTIADIKPFLQRLFRDPLIIRFPLSKLLQVPFAELLIRIRLKEVQKRYQLIGGGSPIFASSQQQVKALQAELDRRGRHLKVYLCFNYSAPLPEDCLRDIKQDGRTAILPLSLYPHYSASTTASNLFYLKQQAQSDAPHVRFLESGVYYLDDNYIQAFADRIGETLNPKESLDDFYLLFSAHGTPLYFLKEGDPYSYQVSQTVSRVLERLKRRGSWAISYQSAVGPLQWLKPSTDEALRALAKRGITKLIVIPISFVTDHIETLCEIDIEYRHFGKGLGITDFRMSRALECHPGFIKALADCVDRSVSNN